MVYQVKKVLGYTSVIALLNSSFYPLYATRTKPIEDHQSFQTKIAPHLPHQSPLPETVKDAHQGLFSKAKGVLKSIPQLLLDVEDKIQDLFVNSTLEFIEELTPDAVKKSLSWIGEEVPEGHNNIVYFREYWQENFREQIEELKKGNVKQAEAESRLRELQDWVHDGTLSPQAYERGLDYLNNFKPLVSRLKTEFRQNLKNDPVLLNQWLEDDLSLFLTRLHQQHFDIKEGMKTFNCIWDYYRGIQNALDYTETLVNFRKIIQKNKDIFHINDEAYWVLNKAIVHAVQSRDEEQYKKLKHLRAEQRKEQEEKSTEFLKIEEELPSYDSFYVTNSSLPNTDDIPASERPKSILESGLKTAKGAAHTLWRVKNYVKEHPFQALTLGLLGQAAAAAAFKAPNPVQERADNQAQKDASQYAKRQTGNQFQISQNATLTCESPVIAALNNDTNLLAWVSGSDSICARLFSLNGAALGNEFQVYQNTIEGVGGGLAAASLSDGKAILVWNTGSPISANLIGQLFFPNGSFFSNNFIINQNTSRLNISPFVAPSPTGADIVWQRNNTDWDIYERSINFDGSFKNNETLLNNITVGDQFGPTLTMLENGNRMAGWVGNSQPGLLDVYAHLYDENITSLSGDISLSGSIPADQLWVQLKTLSNRNILASWSGDQTGANNIYTRLMYPNATFGSNVTQVNVFPTFENINQDIISLGSNEIIFWEGYNNQSIYNVYGSSVDLKGNPSNYQVLINDPDNATYINPRALYMGNNKIFVTYSSNKLGNYQIFGKVVDVQDFVPPTPAPTPTPTSQPNNSTSIPSASVTPSDPLTKVQESSSSSSAMMEGIEIGVPAFLGAAAVTAGTIYGCKKRRGILVVPPQDLEMRKGTGSSTPYGNLSSVISPDSHYENASAVQNPARQYSSLLIRADISKESDKDKNLPPQKPIGDQAHHYDNVTSVQAPGSGPYNTVQIQVVSDPSSQAKPDTANHYDNVTAVQAPGSGPYNTVQIQVVSDPSSQAKPDTANHYDNVTAVQAPGSGPYNTVQIQGSSPQANPNGIDARQYHNVPVGELPHPYDNVPPGGVPPSHPYDNLPNGGQAVNQYDSLPQHQ